MTPIYDLKVLDEETGDLLYEGTFYTEEELEKEGFSKFNYAIERYCKLKGHTDVNDITYTLNYKIGSFYDTIEMKFLIR